jgi:hypothetical protein
MWKFSGNLFLGIAKIGVFLALLIGAVAADDMGTRVVSAIFAIGWALDERVRLTQATLERYVQREQERHEQLVANISDGHRRRDELADRLERLQR